MNVNISFGIFIDIMMLTCIADFMIEFLRFNYAISLVIGLIILIATNIVLIRKNKIKIINNFKLTDLFILLPLGVIFGSLMLFCDDCYDTYNYHIYLQENYFKQQILFDYLPNACSFFFPLGDRVFYIFRFLLGYRLGTIISIYLYIVMFYQIKYLINLHIPNIKHNLSVAILAALPLLTINFGWRIGTYHVDMFSMIIIFEAIKCFLDKDNIFNKTIGISYIVLLGLLSVSVKIINAFIIVVPALLVIFYCIKENKKIIVKSILIGIVLFSIILLPYLMNNFIQTGNPIFPFANNVFKSVYYKNLSGEDTRFGITHIYEYLIFPIEIVIFPLKAYNYEILDPLWGIGYIFTVLYLIKNRKNRKSPIYHLAIMNMVMTLIWEVFLNGYIRYALVIPVCYYLIIIAMLVDSIENAKKVDSTSLEIIPAIFKVTMILLSILFILVYGMVIILLFRIDIGMYYNSKLKFNDIFSYIGNDYERIHIDGAWASANYNSGMISLIREDDTPIYNLDIESEVLDYTIESKFSEYAIKEQEKKIENQKLYTITSKAQLNNSYEIIEYHNYRVVSLKEYTNSKIQNANDVWYILELEKVSEDV